MSDVFLLQTAQAARHLSKKAYPEAIVCATEAIGACRTYCNAYFVRAEAFRLQGKLAAAVDDLGFCLAIDAAHERSHHCRGLCLLEMRRFSQAATHFLLSLKHQTRPETTTLINLGRSYQELGQLEAAMKEYDRALRQEPSNAYAYFCRGHCRLLLGDSEGANMDFEVVMRYEPKFHLPYAAKAAEAESRGEWSRADDIYTALLDHLPLQSEDHEYLEKRRDKARRLRSPSKLRAHLI